MATVLKRKLTKHDTTKEVIDAIYKLATDRNRRLLLTDCVDWLETKMREIRRLVTILRNRY